VNREFGGHQNIFVCLLLTTLLSLAVPPFHGSAQAQQCRTEQQAKRAFPDAHLYWHTSAHCWDNVPTDAANERDRLRQAVEVAARPKPLGFDQKSTTTIYPNMMRGGPPPSADFFYAGTFDRQPLLFDMENRTEFVPWDRRISGAVP
jgi:hypothetical protein